MDRIRSGLDFQLTDARYMLRSEMYLHEFDLHLSFDGNGEDLVPGIEAFRPVSYDGEIVGWMIITDQPGHVTIDIQRANHEAFPPTDNDSICRGAEPVIDTAQKVYSDDLTSWDTTVNRGDIFRVLVTETSDVGRADVYLFIRRLGVMSSLNPPIE